MLDFTSSDPDFNHWWWFLGVQIWSRNCLFSYNKNPKKALNTTSLECCLPSTDAIDRQEKIHSWVWRFKVTSWKCTSIKSTRFSQKKGRILFWQWYILYIFNLHYTIYIFNVYLYLIWMFVTLLFYPNEINSGQKEKYLLEKGLLQERNL